ncbi:hypothetical protein BKA61DRAFT_178413 [Leptodontidium sp. MPI-SDFR-AT-0119]|nr:hypothetical protein BKA61DRAFT_178413 [Leptodontidium sp. MPI-SDFR-AT-0119]
MDFLEDRPSVCSGIKRLRMEWDGEYSPHWLDDKIVVFCEYVSEHLELGNLVFVFSTTVSVARYLLAHDDVKWVKAFRKMKVKTLQLHLHLENDEASGPDVAEDHAVDNIEDVDDVQTDEEPDSEHDANSADGASDGDDFDQGGDGGSDDDAFLNSEDESEAARESLIRDFTPLLEALLRLTESSDWISEEQRYLDARALLVAP